MNNECLWIYQIKVEAEQLTYHGKAKINEDTLLVCLVLMKNIKSEENVPTFTSFSSG